MKTTITLLAVLTLAPLFANAEPITMKGGEISAFRANLSVLSDGSVERVVDQGKDIYGNAQPQKVARTPFEFSGKVRVGMIKNLAVLTAEEKRLEEGRQAIVKGAGVTEATKPDDAANKTALKEIQALYDAPVTMELTKFTLDELDLAKNPLGSTVTALAAIVTELSPPITAKKEELAKR